SSDVRGPSMRRYGVPGRRPWDAPGSHAGRRSVDRRWADEAQRRVSPEGAGPPGEAQPIRPADPQGQATAHAPQRPDRVAARPETRGGLVPEPVDLPGPRGAGPTVPPPGRRPDRVGPQDERKHRDGRDRSELRRTGDA